MKQAHDYDMEKVRVEIQGRKDLAEAKGQIVGELNEKQGFSILDEYKNIKKGLHDTKGVVPGIFLDSEKDTWSQEDFDDAYEIKTGLEGDWRPVEKFTFNE
jgi:hypothetical protein